jgi:hypothetical protein
VFRLGAANYPARQFDFEVSAVSSMRSGDAPERVTDPKALAAKSGWLSPWT